MTQPFARFEVFMSMKIQVEVFYVVMARSVVVGYNVSEDHAASL
jgi:hypothetical protein